MRVAVGDFAGTGYASVVTATGPGGGPRVRVIDPRTRAVQLDFFAYEEGYRGGMFVAVGDVNGDGVDDIVTAPDAGGGPRVQVFSGKDGAVLFNQYVYDPSFIGVTGSIEQLEDVASSVAAALGTKQPDGSYQADAHTTQVTGIDSDDQAPIYWGATTSSAQFAQDIHTLLGKP